MKNKNWTCRDEKCKYYNHNVETHCLHFIQQCYKDNLENNFKNALILLKSVSDNKIIDNEFLENEIKLFIEKHKEILS